MHVDNINHNVSLIKDHCRYGPLIQNYVSYNLTWQQKQHLHLLYQA